MKRHPLLPAAAVLAVLALLAAACGGDDDDGGSTGGTDTGTTSAPAESSEETAEESTDDAMAEDDDMAEPDEAMADDDDGDTMMEADPMDTNGDGKVVLGVAAAGPRDDGAYYQALVDAAYEISAANNWEDPVIIDNIEPAIADTELENLVAQGVDIVAVGAGEIADPLPDLVERYPDVFWYCNCGTGYPQTEGVALSTNDGAEIEYVAGYATGMLLRERGGDSVAMIGCCDLGFEVETELAFRLGLQDVDPSYDVIYTPTGNYPFDFDNVAGATEAFNVALEAGMDAVYPYLGGAHEPLVQLANENDVIVMSAGSSKVCERTDLHWDMAVLFDGGDFARAIFPGIVAGEVQEGSIYTFRVGRDPEVGSKICGATPEQQEELEGVHAAVWDGLHKEAFGEIKGIAYGGG